MRNALTKSPPINNNQTSRRGLVAQVDGDVQATLLVKAKTIGSLESVVEGVGNNRAGGGDDGAISRGVVEVADLKVVDGGISSLGLNARSIGSRPAGGHIDESPLGPSTSDAAVLVGLNTSAGGETTGGTLRTIVESNVLDGAGSQVKGLVRVLAGVPAVYSTRAADLVPVGADHVLGSTVELGGVVVLRGNVLIGNEHHVAAVWVTNVASLGDLGIGSALLGGGRVVGAVVGEAGVRVDAAARGGGRSGGSSRIGRCGGSSQGSGGRGSGSRNAGGGAGSVAGVDNQVGSGRAVVLGLGPRDSLAINDGLDHVANVALLNLVLLVQMGMAVAMGLGRGSDGTQHKERSQTSSHCDGVVVRIGKGFSARSGLGALLISWKAKASCVQPTLRVGGDGGIQ